MKPLLASEVELSGCGVFRAEGELFLRRASCVFMLP